MKEKKLIERIKQNGETKRKKMNRENKIENGKLNERKGEKLNKESK